MGPAVLPPNNTLTLHVPGIMLMEFVVIPENLSTCIEQFYQLSFCYLHRRNSATHPIAT